ncbi:acetyl-CoA synthetase-like protein [Periconia macrospinosa]|uniref:Acetyl-CoA synthetase-like protein n=1 Tax=Periconia macrospinosa TaxID=97972 RepID=A0A2V1DFI7_9PLEO|nr:acetyl-CoA synthetase-like protein [Periconia macrospinosa]
MALSFSRPDLWVPTRKGIEEGYKKFQHRSLPSLVDFNATHNPHYLFAIQAQKHGDEPLQLQDISHSQLRDAILRCQSWLETNVKELQPPVEKDGVVNKGSPVALLMESDVGLFIHQIALLGLGVPVLLLSARLNPLAVRKLLDATGSKAILASRRLSRTAGEATQSCEAGTPESVYERQHFSSFLDAAAPVPSEWASEDRTAIILHSSGTTGFPKPIYQSHEYLVGFALCHELSRSEAESRNLSTLPLFHGFGVLAPCLSLSIGLTMCMPVNSICSADAVIELIQRTGARSMMTVPSVLDDLSQLRDDSAWDALRSLQFVATGGGPLPAAVGDKLVAGGVQIINHFGATEVGALSPVFSKKSQPDYDHGYIRLRKDFDLSIEDVDVSENRCKLITYPFGWNVAFPIQDQFIRRPGTQLDLKVASRTDDVIVLATGEKVLPGVMETAFAHYAGSKTAIVVGHGRFEVGLLIEPRQTPEDFDAFRDEVWAFVEQVNQKVDTHARLSSRNAIVFLPAGQSVPRSDKGSVLRQEAYRMFDHLIVAMYEQLEAASSITAPALDFCNLESGIKSLIEDQLDWKIPSNEWTIEQDLFELGMDSLQALQLRRLLSAANEHEGRSALDNSFIYRYPSVVRLARALLQSEQQPAVDMVDQLIQQYCGGSARTGHVILLTGATGGLGSHLVQHLTSLPEVAKVLCVARAASRSEAAPSSDALHKLQKSFESKGLKLGQDAWAKVEVVQCDFSKPRLGLGSDGYDQVSSQVSHILHNGWPMDFNRRVGSFEAQFQLTRDLMQLARDAREKRPQMKPTFLFVSSIAVVGKYQQKMGDWMVPEVPMRDSSCTDEFGYAQAKLVCEKMVEHHARRGDIVAKYVRVGQMTGARNTALWNSTEHFPALVKSSQHLKALPKLSGVNYLVDSTGPGSGKHDGYAPGQGGRRRRERGVGVSSRESNATVVGGCARRHCVIAWHRTASPVRRVGGCHAGRVGRRHCSQPRQKDGRLLC